MDEILKEIENYFGFVPKIFQVLSDNPPVLKAYFEKSDVIMKDDSLSILIKEFVAIGAAAALGAEHCLSTHLKVARDLGATNDQVLSAIIMGSTIAETNVLAQSLRVYEDLK